MELKHLENMALSKADGLPSKEFQDAIHGEVMVMTRFPEKKSLLFVDLLQTLLRRF
jgi:hypothetical protein